MPALEIDHVKNGEKECKTARDRDPRTRERRAVPTAGKQGEARVQGVSRKLIGQSNPVSLSSEEQVQMFQEM